MPKGKRVEWARQSKEEIRGIRKRFSRFIPDKSFAEAMGFERQDFNVSHSVKVDFLLRNREGMVKASKRFGLKAKDVRHDYRATLLDWAMATENKAEVDGMFREVAGIVAVKKTKPAVKKIEEKAKDYLKARRIPFNIEILDRSLSYIFGKSKLSWAVDGFDFRGFEREYLDELKKRRAADQFLRTRYNFFIGTAFPDVRLTVKQRTTVKKWLERNSEKMFVRPIVELEGTHRTESEKTKAYYEVEKEFVEALRTHFLPQFVKPGLVVTVRKPTVSEPRKLGTRKERTSAYQKTQTETVSTRKRKLTSAQIHAQTSNKRFNVVEHCLSEISHANVETGDFLRNLVRTASLNENGLVSLYTSGNLNQRVFREILSQTNFERQFGGRNINVLARGIAHVGPQGRKVDHVKRAFQSPRAEEIFNFLVRNKFLDTAHGKNMVYLTRF